VAIAAALAVGIAPAQTPIPAATHDALFASFIPIREVAAKPELVGAFTQAREGIWMAAGQAPAFPRAGGDVLRSASFRGAVRDG